MANKKYVEILKKGPKNGISGGKIILKKKSRKIEAGGSQQPCGPGFPKLKRRQSRT